MRIGHTYLIHAYLGVPAVINNLVSQSVTYWLTPKNIRTFTRKATTQQPASQIIENLKKKKKKKKKNRVLPTSIEQTLLEIGLTVLSLIEL